MNTHFEDEWLIRQLVERWAVWRDAGDWERFATVWHPQGVMMATWFQGPYAEFIRVTQEGWARGRMSETQANAVSVRVELQADCLAGVWAFHSQQGKGWLEAGDIESALNAASKIGDDTLERNAGRAVVPDTFTHGTSAQRVGWFKRGLAAGRVKDCDTFQDRSL